jgi:hypothetical protein
MNRREALAGCAALAAPVHLAARGGGVSGPTAGVAWGMDALAVLRLGEAARLHTLDGPLADAPALTADAVWTLTASGRLQRWPFVASPGQSDTRLLAPTPHALAASADGRVVALAQADALVLLDATAPPDAPPLKVYAGTDVERRRRARAAALRALPSRRSLLATWPSLGEWWEVSLDPAAPPLYEGLVHDHRMGEGLPTPGYLAVRRAPLGDAMPTPDHIGATQPWVAGRAGDDVAVVHLDVRREIARGKLPHGNAIVEIDPRRWVIAARHDAPGAVLALQALPAGIGGDAVRLWGLFEVGGRVRLATRIGGAWTWLDGAARHPTSCVADTARRRLLVMGSDPPAVTSLDGEGRTTDTWSLPAGFRGRGLAIPPQPL